MKFSSLVFFVLFILPVLSYSQKFSTAFEYLKYINDKENAIADDMWNYTSAQAHSKRDSKILKKKADLIKTVRSAKNDIRRMPPYKGETNLRDSVVAYFDFFEKMLDGDLTVMDKLKFESTMSYDAMKAYLDKQDEVNRKLTDRSNSMNKEIKKFAAIHNIEVSESNDKISTKMKIANFVNTYYNQIYILYFHCLISQTFAIKAINDADTTNLKKWSDSLRYAIDEGRKQIKHIAGYNNDLSLRNAFVQVLNKFDIEQKQYFPEILKHYRLKKKLYDEKTIIENKPKTELTVAEVENYNKMVDDYNNSVKKNSDIIKRISDINQEITDIWDNAEKAFLDKHTPK